MRKLGKAALIVAALASVSACSKVPAGHKGVKVYLLGTDKGVDHEELSPGRYWIGFNEDLFLFPTFMQNTVWTAPADAPEEEKGGIGFQTSEGLKVRADIGISYAIDPAKVSDIFEKYRKGVDEITGVYLKNMVRDAFNVAASSRKIELVYGEGKAEILAEVERRVREQVAPIGIIVERIYWAGELYLPKSVEDSLNLKIEATQRAAQRLNEVAEAKAEAEKLREKAKGEADAVREAANAEAAANREVAASLTPALVQYRALQAWDGTLPRFTGGDGPVPFLNVDGQ